MIAFAALLAMISPGPSSALPRPDARQLAWHRMEKLAFIHFGPNTFNDVEWGTGREDPRVFNPTALDCRQWARTAKAAGFKGIILTAKHHDGFCLWPSRFSTQTVAASPWKGGKGDVVRELADACREFGLKLGVYLSPWDRNHPDYGTDRYNDAFVGMLEEVLSNYGPIFEVWFDGANGEGPNGKRQVYDWSRYIATIRRLQPRAVIFGSDQPDLRWVGNEAGYAGETNWNTLKLERGQTHDDVTNRLEEGDEDGERWIPAESDVSIRPGWFYSPRTDGEVKSPARLQEIYEQTVGRNSVLLLNLPPDRRGLLADPDVKALEGFAERLRQTYGRPTVREGVESAKGAVVDRLQVREDIRDGQRVRSFRIEGREEGAWRVLARGTTIGTRRILPIEPTRVEALRTVIEDARPGAKVSPAQGFATPETRALGTAVETKAARDRRMAWWREARYGMFVHWGLYALPAGVWNGQKVGGAAEWLPSTAQIKTADWTPLAQQWNPTAYDPAAWVKLAKDAGMKYLVITSKHHEGFALWPSRQGDFHVGNTPYRRDLLGPLVKEARKQGLKIGFYHSILDWHHPDFLPRRDDDPRPQVPADFDRYVRFMKAQLKEILTAYGPIDVVWFDGSWLNTWNDARGRDLLAFVRKLQPNAIVNNRVGVHGGKVGDFGTPEQEIPANGLPGTDWESCMTLNDTWGYSSHDDRWKSAETVLQNLIDCASKGGNYLLNVGPDASGVIPEASARILREAGAWLKVHGEAVYGTVAGPLPRRPAWGAVTRRGDRLYVCVFDRSADRVRLAGLSASVLGAKALADGRKVAVEAGPAGLELEVPRDLPGPIRVVCIDLRPGRQVEVVEMPIAPLADGSFELSAPDAQVVGSRAKLEPEKNAIGFWTDASERVRWNLNVVEVGHYSVELELACAPEWAGSVVEVVVEGNRVRFTVPATAGWGDFRKVAVGRIPLIHPGRTTLEVVPVQMPAGAVMNLRAVRLRR